MSTLHYMSPYTTYLTQYWSAEGYWKHNGGWAANLDVLEPHNACTLVSKYSVRKNLLSYADWKIFYLLH